MMMLLYKKKVIKTMNLLHVKKIYKIKDFGIIFSVVYCLFGDSRGIQKKVLFVFILLLLLLVDWN